MSSKAMQARVRPLQSYDSESFIVMWTNFNCSSKLYFEENLNRSLVKKNSKNLSVDFFRCRHGFYGQISCCAIPAKSAKNFIISAKISKGK